MQSWKQVWRRGAAPLLSTSALEALQTALRDDDPRLVQGATTNPPPLDCYQDCAIEAACALGFCRWQTEGLTTVAEADEAFAGTCFEINQRIGEPAASRWFLNWFDDTPREEMRRELLIEVQRELCRRCELVELDELVHKADTAAA